MHGDVAMLLQRSGIWHLRSENKNGEHAKSCRQAVTIRSRLGAVQGHGIPLWSELKSEFRVFRSRVDDALIAIAVHCRANRQIRGGIEDRSVPLKAIGLVANEWIILPRSDASDSEIFGLVNPLTVNQVIRGEFPDFEGDIYQIFDNSLFGSNDIPNTMITNDGSFTHSIEFMPNDLFAAVKELYPNTIRAEVSEVEPEWVEHKKHKEEKKRLDWLRFPPPSGPKIGILTGNSPESGIMLMEDMLDIFRGPELFQRTATDINMPEIMLYSCPAMGLTMELIQRKDAAWTSIKEAVLHMIDAGCEIITVACNTTAYFQQQLREICENRSVEFISIVDACLDELQRLDSGNLNPESRKVGLVGIGPVVDLNKNHSGYAALRDVGHYDLFGVDATDLAYAIKNAGENKRKLTSVTNQFRRQLREELPGVDTVVIALTEASIVYRNHMATMSKKDKQSEKTVVFIDPVKSLAEKLIYEYLISGYRKSELVGLPKGYALEPVVAGAIF